jgi:hypothetical protein
MKARLVAGIPLYALFSLYLGLLLHLFLPIHPSDKLEAATDSQILERQVQPKSK